VTATPLDRLLSDLRAGLAAAKDCKPGGAAGNVCNGVACDFLSEHGDALLARLAAAARAEGFREGLERAARYVEICTLGQCECAAAIRALDVEDR
jgi:hypothetical protein